MLLLVHKMLLREMIALHELLLVHKMLLLNKQINYILFITTGPKIIMLGCDEMIT